MPAQNTKPADYPQAVLQQIGLLAQHIVIARKRRNETQAEWAQRLGVSQPTMARIERGDPSVAMASYVMCMWLINPALGLADLIAPQNDMASLEREVARIRKPSRPRKARASAQPAAPATHRRGEARQAGEEPTPHTAAPREPGTPHRTADVQPLPWTNAPRGRANPSTPVSAGLSVSEPVGNSTAAGLAALIAGAQKAKP